MKSLFERLGTGAVVTFIVSIVLAILMCFIIFIAVKSSGSESSVDENPSPKTEYSDTAFLEAVQRMHPMADKICKVKNTYANSRTAFLIHYPDGVDEHWNGWFLIYGIEFYDFGNNKLSVAEVTDANRYHKVFPDVLGLQCVGG